MEPVPFAYKTQPLGHQREILRRTHNLMGYGLLWEMGCGKTKPTIDLAAYLASKGRIGGVLVVAPNGVHTNWVTDELPKHLGCPYDAHAYYVTQAKAQGHETSLRRVLHSDFPVLSISYNALLNTRLLSGNERRSDYLPSGGILVDFIKQFRPLVVFDESSKVKNPKGAMSLRARALARMCAWRRILEGTPVSNGPFDAFAQFMLLDENFWGEHGLGSFTAFKNEFGVFVRNTRITIKNKDGTARKGPNAHPNQRVAYKNLESLHRMIEPVSHRLLKEDVLDLPPKTYQYRPFELSPRQRQVYEQLRKDQMVEIEGNLITATMPIVRLLRLHQITSNYLPTGIDDETTLVDPDHNPRLDALADLCEEIPHQSIIWARFVRDSDLIAEMLTKLGRSFVRYDGSSSDVQKAEALRRFHAGDAQFIIGRTQSGLARGQTLVEAKTVVYYNNTFTLGDRLQSEDRAHRIGQTSPVLYIDLVASRTVDRRIVEALRAKFDIAAQVTHDRVREWLQ